MPSSAKDCANSHMLTVQRDRNPINVLLLPAITEHTFGIAMCLILIFHTSLGLLFPYYKSITKVREKCMYFNKANEILKKKLK